MLRSVRLSYPSVWGGAMSSEIDKILSGRLSRRELVKKAGIGAGGVMMAGLISACGGSSSTTTTAGGTAATTTGGTTATTGAAPTAGTIKIGFVSPRTGPAAGFGEPDPYVIGLAKKAFANGLRSAARPTRSRSSTRTARPTRNAAPKSRRS